MWTDIFIPLHMFALTCDFFSRRFFFRCCRLRGKRLYRGRKDVQNLKTKLDYSSRVIFPVTEGLKFLLPVLKIPAVIRAHKLQNVSCVRLEGQKTWKSSNRFLLNFAGPCAWPRDTIASDDFEDRSHCAVCSIHSRTSETKLSIAMNIFHLRPGSCSENKRLYMAFHSSATW